MDANGSPVLMTLSERLTAEFYAWEQLGRGWQVWPELVGLEPPFRPFVRCPANGQLVDDGRRAGVFERLWRRLTSAKRSAADLAGGSDTGAGGAGDEPAPGAKDASDRSVIRIHVAPDTDHPRSVAERIVTHLGSSCGSVSFEVVSAGGEVALQLAVNAHDVEHLVRALESFAPTASVIESADDLRTAWSGAAGSAEVVDFGLANEFMLPVAVETSAQVDPLVDVVAVLHGVRAGELAVFQVLFQRAAHPWTESAARALRTDAGDAFFADVPELLARAEEKLVQPLHAAIIRVGIRSDDDSRVRELVYRLVAALDQFDAPNSNRFIPLTNDDYPIDVHVEDVLNRTTHRGGMLLSTRELAALVHLPQRSLQCASLRLPARLTRAAPPAGRGDDLVLGENVHRGRTSIVRVPQSLRSKHMHIIGATGTGKSTLLRSLITQDMEAGRGLVLLDPHGDLVEELLGCVPERRHGDIVLFDPSDTEYSVGFNVLAARSTRDKELLASDLVHVFRRFSTSSWGDQMTAVLGNAVLAFLESAHGGTIIDLRNFLLDRSYREEFLATVGDPEVRLFWEKEFRLLSGRPQVPLLTRLDAFIRPKALRDVVGERDSQLDLRDVMDTGKVFLAKLASGSIGEENARLLGSLLVSKFHQAALSRAEQPEQERRDFVMYLDEFHQFVTPSLTGLLTGARKYHVGLVLAHQDLEQVKEAELQAALLANTATRVCFRTGEHTARRLADGFANFQASDFSCLGVGEAICRFERSDLDFNLRVIPGTRPDSACEQHQARLLRRRSMQTYGRLRSAEPAAAAPGHEGETGAVKAPSTAVGITVQVSVPRPAQAATKGAPPPKTATANRKASIAPDAIQRVIRAQNAGRGGPQHKYLQHLVKGLAEDKGYRANLEATLDGGGRADVLLERGSELIACEISITSTVVQEVGNIRKCLEAGASQVILISPHRRLLQRARTTLEGDLEAALFDRVSFCTPEELVDKFQESLTSTSSEQDVIGYKVKTTHNSPTVADGRQRMATVAATVLKALKRLAPDNDRQ